jgi:hypothetical protein
VKLFLQNGIWETRDTDQNVINTRQFANWACNSFKLGTSGELFSTAKGGLDVSSNSCSGSKESYFLSKTFRQRIKTEAKGIVQAWTTCMDSLGGHASILHTDDLKQFTILLRVNGTEVNEENVRITANQDFSCSLFDKSELQRGITVPRVLSLSCIRTDPSEGLSLDVNFETWARCAKALVGRRRSSENSRRNAHL